MKVTALLLVLLSFVSNGAFAEEGAENTTVTKRTIEVVYCSGEERDPLVEGNTWYYLGSKTTIETAYTSVCEDKAGKKRFELIRFFFKNPHAWGALSERLGVLYFNSAGVEVFQKVVGNSRDFVTAMHSSSLECPVLVEIEQKKDQSTGKSEYDLTYSTECSILD